MAQHVVKYVLRARFLLEYFDKAADTLLAALSRSLRRRERNDKDLHN